MYLSIFILAIPETAIIRTGQNDVNIEGENYNNKTFDNHEAIQAFYRTNLSRKKMKEIQEQRSEILKEATLFLKHMDVRQHMVIFQR